MAEFIAWIFAPQNANSNTFALLTVIMSGVISWIISAIYFHIGNRNNLIASVIQPMKRILSESYSWKNYKMLEELLTSYSAKYLWPWERSKTEMLLSAYKEVCTYDYDHVCASSLFSYFKYKLKQNGVEPAVVPIYIDDELVDVDVPADLLYMEDDLARVINRYPPGYDTDNCTESVVAIFNAYCKKNYTDKAIVFFDDYDLESVLKNSRVRADWDKKLDEMKAARTTFEEMSVTKK